MSEFKITKEHVWVSVIGDKTGSLASKLRLLRDSGVNLELIITRRERQDRALMFVSPLRTEVEIGAANAAGLSIADSLHNLRIESPNGPGLGARITTALEEAGVNMRGFSAAALGEQQVTNIAFDSLADLERAKQTLEQALKD